MKTKLISKCLKGTHKGGLSWAMASEPAVMLAFGYTSSPNGVKTPTKESVKEAEKLRNNIGILGAGVTSAIAANAIVPAAKIAYFSNRINSGYNTLDKIVNAARIADPKYGAYNAAHSKKYIDILNKIGSNTQKYIKAGGPYYDGLIR